MIVEKYLILTLSHPLIIYLGQVPIFYQPFIFLVIDRNWCLLISWKKEHSSIDYIIIIYFSTSKQANG